MLCDLSLFLNLVNKFIEGGVWETLLLKKTKPTQQ